MTKRIVFGCCLAVILAKAAFAQKVYSLDASRVSTEVKSGYFNMGDPGPADKKILVNSRYITIGGKPVIPVMGELQYSRMPLRYYFNYSGKQQQWVYPHRSGIDLLTKKKIAANQLLSLGPWELMIIEEG